MDGIRAPEATDPEAERRVARALEGLAILAARQGSAFMVVNIPDKAAWTRRGVEDRDGSLPGFCDAQPARCLDLRERAPENPDALYLPVDPHWNARGHAWAAERIAERLTGLVSVVANVPR